MGRFDTFEIFLSNQCGEVEAGSLLQGQVVLECSDDLEVKDIVVHCFGKCRVQWVDTRSAAPLAEVQAGITPPVTAEENYINEVFSCFPSSDECDHSDTTKLPKGLHTFDFSFEIPASAPASFTTEHGFIKYCVRAQVHLPNNRVENNVRYFTVRPVFDLNRVPNVEEPVEKKAEVDVNSLFHNHGKCQAKLALPKRGFVLGDKIPVTALINNESSKELSKARLRLRMVTKYSIKSQSCTGDKILSETRVSPVEAGSPCQHYLQIPKDLPASHLHGCRYMYVKYYVEFFIRPSLLSVKKLKLSIKIHLGTIPISVAREQAYLRMQEAPPSYDDLPPSYHDAIQLHLKEIQLNTQSDQAVRNKKNTSTTPYACSGNTHCKKTHINHDCGASCSNNNVSFKDNLCSSVDSLNSMEETGMVHKKSQTKRESENKKNQRPHSCRSENLPTPTSAEELRIAVVRRNLARAREELPTNVNRANESSNASTSRPTHSKKSFTAIINSFFLTFPVLMCHEMK